MVIFDWSTSGEFNIDPGLVVICYMPREKLLVALQVDIACCGAVITWWLPGPVSESHVEGGNRSNLNHPSLER
jgi:hypothetical protein